MTSDSKTDITDGMRADNALSATAAARLGSAARPGSCHGNPTRPPPKTHSNLSSASSCSSLCSLCGEYAQAPDSARKNRRSPWPPGSPAQHVFSPFLYLLSLTLFSPFLLLRSLLLFMRLFYSIIKSVYYMKLH